MWFESWNKYEQQQVQVEQKETSLEQKLDFLSNATWNKRDYENFIKFLETKKWIKEYNSILEWLQNPDYTEDILWYIEENWFPTWNKFNQFVKDFFDIDIQEEKKEEVEEKKENAENEKEKIKIWS